MKQVLIASLLAACGGSVGLEEDELGEAPAGEDTSELSLGTKVFSEADAFVRSGAYAAQSFGTGTRLDVDGESEGTIKEAYLRFRLPTLPRVSRARLRVYVNNGANTGPTVRTFSRLFDERTVTWNNRPPASVYGTTVATIGSASTGAWKEIDLTTTVQGMQAQTPTPVLQVAFLPRSSDSFWMNSREASSNRPELILEYPSLSPDMAPPADLAARDLAAPPSTPPKAPVNGICQNHFFLTSSIRLPYCTNRLLHEPNPAFTRAVIVIHGASLNADDYYANMYKTAQAAGATNNTLIVAPQFLESNPGSEIAYWNGGWREGDASVNSGDRVSSYEALNLILAQIERTFASISSVTVVGHSAGGQVVSRFVAGSREPGRLTIRYIAANPSSWLYLDGRRPVAGTSETQFATPSDTCGGDYDDYKYGLQALNSYMGNLGASQIRSTFAQKRLVYLLGDADTTSAGGLDTSCPGMRQGRHRYERGKAYFNFVNQYYAAQGISLAGRHTKVVVPGVGHDNEAMFNSPEGRREIFP